jgi:hypothetical protein
MAEHPGDDDGVSEDELREFVADVERMIKVAAGEHEAEVVLSSGGSLVAEGRATPGAGGGVDRHIQVSDVAVATDSILILEKTALDPAMVGITADRMSRIKKLALAAGVVILTGMVGGPLGHVGDKLAQDAVDLAYSIVRWMNHH